MTTFHAVIYAMSHRSITLGNKTQKGESATVVKPKKNKPKSQHFVAAVVVVVVEVLDTDTWWSSNEHSRLYLRSVCSTGSCCEAAIVKTDRLIAIRNVYSQNFIFKPDILSTFI